MKFLKFLPLFMLFVNLNAIMLLEEYKDENLTNWYMSEKLDGIRAVWDGKDLISRNGYKFMVPKWFTADFPNEQLDGELFTKRDDFANISSITSKLTPHDGWRDIKFYIFDMPKMDANFSLKIKYMEKISKDSKFIEVIPQKIAKSNEEVFKFLDDVVLKGGEGVVVRSPDLIYENKRSNKILKLKKFKDKECEVVKINEGNGKYKGFMGSVDCKMDDGTIFRIGSGFSDEDRINPPKIGDQITYKYQDLTKSGKPRFPVFLRIRDEL